MTELDAVTVTSAVGLGLLCVGLDLRGQPIYAMMAGWAAGGERVDTPYELNLSPDVAYGLPAPGPIDNPYSPAEMERILRAYDVDASTLPLRLFALIRMLSCAVLSKATLP